MMKLKFEYIVIIVLIIIILLQRACSGSKPETTTIVKTETKWDTIKQTTPLYVPKWYLRIKTNIDTFTIPIDTIAILKDYYAIYNYSDTLGTDSVKIIINDSVTQNKIKSRVVDYKIMYPTITITKETTINKLQFYYGLGIGASNKGLNSFGPELMYKSKSNQAYGLGFNIDQTLSPSLTFKMYWKIGK